MSEVERVVFAIGVTVMVVAGMIALMRGASIVYTLGELSNSPPQKADEYIDWDVRTARQLMFEMVGGEPGARLRDQYA